MYASLPKFLYYLDVDGQGVFNTCEIKKFSTDFLVFIKFGYFVVLGGRCIGAQCAPYDSCGTLRRSWLGCDGLRRMLVCDGRKRTIPFI